MKEFSIKDDILEGLSNDRKTLDLMYDIKKVDTKTLDPIDWS
jgi:hypothetical protein